VVDCPKCQYQFDSGDECPRCGVIIAKALARLDPKPARKKETQPPPARPVSPSRLSLTARQRAIFLRQLGQILDSGMSIHAGLTVLGGASSKPVIQRLAAHLKSGLDSGSSLSEAFSSSEALSPLGLRMLKTHEQAGGLPAFFFAQSEQLEEQLKLRNNFLAALVYPGLVLILSVFLLPLPTLVLDGLAAYATIVFSELALLAIIGAALWLGPRYLFRSPTLKNWANSLLWYIPVVGRFYRQRLRSEVTRGLARGLDAGMTPREILPALAKLSQAGEFQRAMTQALDASKKGEPMVQILTPTLVNDPAHRLTLSTGEESGTLVDALGRIDNDLRERLRRNLRATMQLVSVLAMTAMILVVALQTVSAYQNQLSTFHKSLDGVMKGSGINLKNPTDLKEIERKFRKKFESLDKNPQIRKELKGVFEYAPPKNDD